MKKIILIIIVFVLLIAMASAANRWLNGESVTVVHPVRGSAVQAVYATGTVEPTVMLPIAPRSAARLIELSVDEGDEISKGQVLARLEDDDTQQLLKQLEIRQEFAKKEYERNAFLVKNKVASKQVYDRAKADWEAAVSATKETQAKLDYLKLIAPEDGLIIKRDGEIGQFITVGTPVFWVSCCAPLRISVEIDEEDIAQVKIGQEVLIRSDAFTGQIFHGKVKAITPKGDPISRSYRVRVEFTEETPLKIGMTAETNIIISKKDDALLLPSSAVSQNKIWQVVDGKLVRKVISIGAKEAEQTEISGITENDLVVLKPDTKMQEGHKVNASIVDYPKPKIKP